MQLCVKTIKKKECSFSIENYSSTEDRSCQTVVKYYSEYSLFRKSRFY